MSRQRRRYDDKFRASAVVMLEAAGYPDKKGALEQTSKRTGVPISTLHGWFNATRNPPPADVRNEKRKELRELLEDELRAIFQEMPNARSEAGYKDLGTVAGILFDKKQLIDGKPTQITEDVSNLSDEERSNRITAIFDKARARRTGLAIN